MIRRVLTAAAVAAACTSAQAGVVYNWVTVSTSPTITAPFGRLEVSQAAYQAGSLFESFSLAGTNGARVPNGPVEQFTFGIGGGVPGFVSIVGGMTVQAFESTDGRFSLALGNTASGSISALSRSEANVSLSSVADLFTVTAFNTDFGPNGTANCTNQSTSTRNDCFGATGRFVLDPSTVPAPGVLPLMALGAFGIAGALRRKRKA